MAVKAQGALEVILQLIPKEEVEEVFPGLVRETLSPIVEEAEAGTMRKEIKMSFVPMLVKAVQELSAKVEALENA